MSDTNAVRLGFVRESVAGEVPTTPVFRRFRFTGAPDLGQAPKTVESEEILDDGQRTDLIVVATDIAGSANFEMSFGAHDSLYEAALRGTFQARTSKTQPTHGLNTTTTTFACSTTAGIAVGDLVASEGYVNAANNGLFAVTTVTANTSYTVTAIGGGAPGLVAETAPAGAVLRNVGRGFSSGISIGAPSGGLSVLTGVGTNFSTGLSLEAGDYIRLAGFSTPANNGYVRVVTITSDTVMTVDRLPTGFAAEAGTATNRVLLGERLKNATSRFTYTLQEMFTDIGTAPANTRQLLSGMGVNVLNLNIDSESVVTGQMSFIGQSAAYTIADVSGETFVEAEKWTPLNSSVDVGRIGEGGLPLDTINLPQAMKIEVNNNLAKRSAIGRIGGAGFRRGQFTVSGSLDCYFDDKSKVEKVIAGTETSLDLQFNDTSFHGVVIDFPRVKFSSGAPPVPGRNDDVVVALNWDALKDKTLLYTMKMMRFYRVA